ncbi:MAG: hypothetical protein GWP63_18300 [Haliea sp.]|nr:hypothetical protein [Haliea sp.]
MKYLLTLPALCLAMCLLYLAHGADARAGSHGVNTELAGIKVTTNVDSALARDLLMTGNRAALTRLDCHSVDDLPSAAILREITTTYSTDTATALLIKCLADIPEIRRSQALFLTELEHRRNGHAVQANYISARANQYTVLFVPGWGYLSNGDDTGSNLRRPRQIIAAMGFETRLVPIADFGSVENNARTLADYLLGQLQRGKRIILASASSGGPAVALALGDPDIADHPMLAGWINICGVLRGSPMVDRFQSWPKSLLPRLVAMFEGWTYKEFLSLSRSRGGSRFDQFERPPQLTILNYIGIPFSGQLSPTGRRFYTLLRDMGPNDGLTLITEALAPGYTVMAVGSDHFIREDPDIDMKTAALVPVLLRLIEGQKIQSGHFSAKSMFR